jgi:Domain of unknown function (DUF4806)
LSSIQPPQATSTPKGSAAIKRRGSYLDNSGSKQVRTEDSVTSGGNETAIGGNGSVSALKSKPYRVGTTELLRSIFRVNETVKGTESKLVKVEKKVDNMAGNMQTIASALMVILSRQPGGASTASADNNDSSVDPAAVAAIVESLREVAENDSATCSDSELQQTSAAPKYLPINSVTAFVSFNMKLQDTEFFAHALAYLASKRKADKDVDKNTKLVLNSLFTQEGAQEFTWYGSQTRESFIEKDSQSRVLGLIKGKVGYHLYVICMVCNAKQKRFINN